MVKDIVEFLRRINEVFKIVIIGCFGFVLVDFFKDVIVVIFWILIFVKFV